MINLKKQPYLLILFCFSLIASLAQANNQPLHILSSIRPIDALVTSVVGTNKFTSELIGIKSPHHFQLKPSHLYKIRDADIIFLIDPLFESKLLKAIKKEKPKAKIIFLSEALHLNLLDRRTDNNWQEHDHDHDTHGHDNHGDHSKDHDDHDNHSKNHDDHANGHDNEVSSNSKDLHIWLDTDNAVTMLKYIRDVLSQQNPAGAENYRLNANKAIDKINSLKSTLKNDYSFKKVKPHLVFHDAYQYFEKQWNFSTLGSITLPSVNSTSLTSSKRLKGIYQLIVDHQVKCLYQEPQFSNRLVNRIANDHRLKVLNVDPLGSQVDYDTHKGIDFYIQLIRDMANQFIACQ